MSESSPSAARLAANRANAQLSTGPRTDEGKATVKLNAVKTGLTGRTILLPSDDAEKYQSLLAEFQAALQPVGPLERALVQSIVDCHWRLERIPALEAALINLGGAELAEQSPDFAITLLAPITEMKVRRRCEKDFRNLHLQESRLARRRDKELAELRRLQQERQTKEAAARKEALDRAAEAYLVAQHRNESLDLAALQSELGFEFSTRQLAAHLASLTRAQKDQILAQALKGDEQILKAAA